jgi:hypothetical protein
MTDADDIVIEALLDDVLDKALITDAVDEALRIIQGDGGAGSRLVTIEAEIGAVDAEGTRLAAAIASGGQLEPLLRALQSREARRARLEAEPTTLRSQRRLEASETDRVRKQLLSLAGSWRQMLADDPTHARPIISSLLKGRVIISPTAKRAWILKGEGTFAGLFQAAIFPEGWRPQRASRLITSRLSREYGSPTEPRRMVGMSRDEPPQAQRERDPSVTLLSRSVAAR